MESPVPAQRRKFAAQETGIGASQFAPHRLRRMLIAFGTSLALVLGTLGVLGVGSASASFDLAGTARNGKARPYEKSTLRSPRATKPPPRATKPPSTSTSSTTSTSASASASSSASQSASNSASQSTTTTAHQHTTDTTIASTTPTTVPVPDFDSEVADGLFQVLCNVSHFKADDPIVFPNRPGAAHMHSFYGNTSTDHASTTESLMGSLSTCGRNFETTDKSAYWVPSVYKKNADGTSTLVT